MRRYCKVEPSSVQCNYCTCAHIEENTSVNCGTRCPYDSIKHELLGFGVGIFGRGYAFVSLEGHVYKVSIDRIHDLTTEE